ncbi:MAG: hypothetical protein K9M80_09335 [Candidatus Marinimicrobia bacterium]|nr:hypothetical protein [Candidatus Neomarinimicrobiota bacterium]
MGQQQLLLIALSVLIVGAAVAVGVNMFNQGAEEAELDKFYQHASFLATNATAAYKKPTTMGGLGNDFSTVPTGDVEQACSALGIKDSTGQSNVYVSNVEAGDTDNEIKITLSDTLEQYTGTFIVDGETGDISWDTRVSEQ